MQNNQLFSKEALDKLRSPERLDTMLPITTPIGWMLLVTVGVFLFAVVLWAFFGAFTIKTDGMGLIMDSAGVISVSHRTGGTVASINVIQGEKVSDGDLLAVIEQPEMEADMTMSKYNVDRVDTGREAKQRVADFAHRQINWQLGRNVICWTEGIVDEITVLPGMYVRPGEKLMTIRIDEGSNELTGILYIPVEKGKRVEPGMTVQIVPNGVDASEVGSLVGTVSSVSQYPVSAEAVQNHLGNAQLAGWIMEKQKSSLIEVIFELVRDENSPSGYLWTSQVGEHKKVTPGSYCTGSIVIERRPPIDKVFYKISQWLRSR